MTESRVLITRDYRVEVPTEKRVRKWAISLEELMSDPTGKSCIFFVEMAITISPSSVTDTFRFARVHELPAERVQPREHKILGSGEGIEAQQSGTHVGQGQRDF